MFFLGKSIRRNLRIPNWPSDGAATLFIFVGFLKAAERKSHFGKIVGFSGAGIEGERRNRRG